MLKKLVDAFVGTTNNHVKLNFDWVRGFDVGSDPSKDLRNQLICAILQLTSNYVDEHIESISERIENLQKEAKGTVDQLCSQKTLVSLEDIVQARDWWKFERPMIVNKIDKLECELKSVSDRESSATVDMFSEYVGLLDQIDAGDGKSMMYIICGVNDL